MRLHSGYKPYSCDSCHSRFTQFVHLKLHKRLHSNERPFICGSCAKSYISASGLRTHWKTTACKPSAEEIALTAEKSEIVGMLGEPAKGEEGKERLTDFCLGTTSQSFFFFCDFF